ncbi:MAG: undecaprenyl-phosphate glucose phosphotransferase, partial [Flavobacteriaceae bacterium]|nr:undecaprenyl-phosphate glucose phosphotransferase [Flavobacteriaceae bacterium]
MNTFKHGRYSGYLRPISYAVDLIIINGLALLYFFKNIDPVIFVPIISFSWIILSVYSQFYEVYRYTREVTIASLIIKQLVLFTLVMLAFSGFYHELRLYPANIFKYTLISFLFIAIAKFALYYLLQKYRSSFGGNYRKTVIIGKNKQTLALESFFNTNPEYGYLHKGTFNIKDKRDNEL